MGSAGHRFGGRCMTRAIKHKAGVAWDVGLLFPVCVVIHAALLVDGSVEILVIDCWWGLAACW